MASAQARENEVVVSLALPVDDTVERAFVLPIS